MQALLERVYALRRLIGKCEAGIGLSLSEVEELTTLEAEFLSPHPGRRFSRPKIHGQVVVRRGERCDEARVVDISGGGLRCMDLPRVASGDIAELKLGSGDGLTSYRFMARARHVLQSDDGNCVGFEFCGIPVAMRRRARAVPAAGPLPLPLSLSRLAA